MSGSPSPLRKQRTSARDEYESESTASTNSGNAEDSDSLYSIGGKVLCLV